MRFGPSPVPVTPRRWRHRGCPDGRLWVMPPLRKNHDARRHRVICGAGVPSRCSSHPASADHLLPTTQWTRPRPNHTPRRVFAAPPYDPPHPPCVGAAVAYRASQGEERQRGRQDRRDRQSGLGRPRTQAAIRVTFDEGRIRGRNHGDPPRERHGRGSPALVGLSVESARVWAAVAWLPAGVFLPDYRPNE